MQISSQPDPTLAVPGSLEGVIHAADTSAEPFDEQALWSQLVTSAPPPENCSDLERRGVVAELSAWRFMRSSDPNSGPWGIYWGPLASGKTADGKDFHNPDILDIDPDIIQHWVNRALSLQSPALRARYADLAWEIGKARRRDAVGPAKRAFLIGNPRTLASIAIDGYLDAVEGGQLGNEHDCWEYLDRAVQLSLMINDSVRTVRAKVALFNYQRLLVSRPERFLWWRLDDLTRANRRQLNLNEEENQEIIAGLEEALARSANPENLESFDPHAAMQAADRLAKLLADRPEDAQRVVKVGAGAYEAAAAKVSAMLAIAWLEDLIPRYRSAALIEDAKRVEDAIVSREKDAKKEMSRHSVTVEIPAEQVQKWIDAVAGETADHALSRVAQSCLLTEDSSQRSVETMMVHAPLMSLFSTTIMGRDGFTEATIGSVKDDIVGHALKHAAEQFSQRAQLLHLLLHQTMGKHGLDIEAFLEHARSVPWFALHREPLLREGLMAWFDGDPVKAIHVLVPQVEAACRDLLDFTGGSIRKFNPLTGGFEVIGMGAVLNHPRFVEGVPKDIRFHLRALYCEPRGINLRNHLAHGLTTKDALGVPMANWVVHSVLLLGTLELIEATDTRS